MILCLWLKMVVMSRNSPETGLQVLNTIRHDKLGITRSAFTGGEPVSDYMKAFDVDLFLTTNVEDAQSVIDSGSCATAILREPPENAQVMSTEQVRLAFDGDAVLFSEESELVYKTQGLDVFQRIEDEKQDVPLEEGPYATLLKKLATLQEKLQQRQKSSSIRIALLLPEFSFRDACHQDTEKLGGYKSMRLFFLEEWIKHKF